ncbi:hypothetical protein [Parabacteroides sp. AF19-14]|uniref:hypothetical protein n=1 Tax=Parabacteroides sp. AF19-14 TaxID=2293114 RepID=UPI001F1B46B5|nr:hypothetical protein [Parabacteroides sp. AF19-14]
MSGESVQSFCKRNKVPYNIFQKWYKDTRNKIVEVHVDGIPDVAPSGNTEVSSKSSITNEDKKWSDVRIWIEVCMSNGLHLFQHRYAL